MIEDKIKTSIIFTNELSDWFNRSLPDLISDVQKEDDPEFYSDEPLLTFEPDGIVISENKVKSKIADLLLEAKITDYLFNLEFEKSRNEKVIGYG